MAGAFFLAAVLASEQASLLSFVFLCLVGPGIYGGLGPFWAIPGEVFPRAVAGSAMGLINALGGLGGYFGPLAVGYFNQRTGNFHSGFAVLGVALLASSVLAFLFRPAPAHAGRNAAK
jgi:nitrate/nitrite transporter NarK